MNELFDLIEQLMQYIEANGANLNAETQRELGVFLQEVMSFVNEQQGQQPEPPPEQAPQVPEEFPISDSANLLWILSGGQPNAFVSYLREFPDPSLTNLVNNPDLLAQTIERLQQQEPQNRTNALDGIQQAPLQSSNVYGFQFNPGNKKLRVRFNSGSVYEYDNVPDVVFNLFASGNAAARTEGQNRFGRWWRGKNPSLGASLNQYIKAGGYNYRRLR